MPTPVKPRQESEMIEDLLRAYMAGGKQLKEMFGLSPGLAQSPQDVQSPLDQLPPDYISRLAKMKGDGSVKK